jgi:hypothetical protein
MKRRNLALALAAMPALSAPVMAQSPSDVQRWEAAQARYRAETDLYLHERDRFMAIRSADRGPPPGYYDDRRFATDYDAARDYRDDPHYAERRMGANDQVYRGSDGRYYCKRNDGTTGLIVGGIGGALFGNVLDGGRHRAAGTLIGGGLGALLGKSIDQSNSDVRCR